MEYVPSICCCTRSVESVAKICATISESASYRRRFTVTVVFNIEERNQILSTVELCYNDVGLCDTSPTASDIPRYQLIPHFKTENCTPRSERHKIFSPLHDDIAEFD